MEWVKCHTNFFLHRKRLMLTAHDVGVWFLCLLYVGQQEHRDGFVPAEVLRMVAGRDDGVTIAERLVKARLWEPTEGGWRFHDIDEWQDFAGADHQRELHRQRQAAYRRRVRHGGERSAGEPGVTRDRGDDHVSVTRDEGDGHVTRHVTVRRDGGDAIRGEETQSRPETLPPYPPSLRGEVVGEDGVVPPEVDGFLPRRGEADDFAHVYAAAYRETHAGHDPSGLLMREVISAARVCQREGIPLEHISTAVAACARANGTKQWQFVQALAAVQGGTPRAGPKNPIDAQIEDLLRRAGGRG
jgi:hypothetical protein